MERREAYNALLDFLKKREAFDAQNLSTRPDYFNETEYSNFTNAIKLAINILGEDVEHTNEMRAATIRKLLSGEWVETHLIERFLNISFSEGMHLFDFNRQVRWNPPPLNGQKVETYFRLKQ